MPSAKPVSAGSALLEEGIQAVNFFNGRLLSGRDLSREQEARRTADARLGQGIGPGIVRGLEVSIEGAQSARLLRVGKGLALSAAGQTLCLGADQVFALAPDLATSSVSINAGGFAQCAPLSGGTYVAGDGIYLVTLAPIHTAVGKAEVLALEPGNARCNTDAIIEAVQFRLLRVAPELLASFGIDSNANTPQTISRLRNALAHACFGSPWHSDAHRAIATTQPASVLQAMAARGLSGCDVPLAVVYLNASAKLVFADAWMVRRRVASPAAAPAFAAWIGEPLDALDEAQLAQFQEQLAGIPDTALNGLRAIDWFTWLPPAGFLPAQSGRSIDWKVFLGAQQPASAVTLAASDARAVLAQGLKRDPLRLDASNVTSAYRVYQISNGPWLFTRSAPNRAHAGEIWLDGARAGLSSAVDVQGAIDLLRARTPAQLVCWPGSSFQTRIEQLPASKDAQLYFEAGDYTLSKPIHLKGLGHVTIRGAGPGSKLRYTGDSVVIRIEDCASVTIEDLALVAGQDRVLSVRGALTIQDTAVVRLERLTVQCESGFHYAVDVQQRGGATSSGREAFVAISHCTLDVGEAAIGIRCDDCARVVISDNAIRTVKDGQPPRIGILVGGNWLREARVENNLILMASQGVTVSGREPSDESLPLEQVVLTGNEIQFDPAPTTLEKEPHGIAVSNARSVRLRENAISGRRDAGSGRYGIRLHGAFGSVVVVRDNNVSGALHCISFKPDLPNETPTRPRGLWLLDSNVMSDTQGTGLEIDTRFQSMVRSTGNVVVP